MIDNKKAHLPVKKIYLPAKKKMLGWRLHLPNSEIGKEGHSLSVFGVIGCVRAICSLLVRFMVVKCFYYISVYSVLV